MGQIIIDLPLNVEHHYEIKDLALAAELLEVLQTLASRVKENPEKLTAEDLADVRAANRALERGEFVAWEDAKAYLDR